MGNGQKTWPQSGHDEELKQDSKEKPREIVNLILPDSLMIVLAAIMIPIVLIPLFFDLPETSTALLETADYTILGIFIVEYLSKTILAPNVLRHVLNPWHLLDLLIVIIPLIGLLPGVLTRLSLSSPLLRLARIVRVVAVGGRAVDRKIQVASLITKPQVEVELPMEIRVMDGNLENVYQDVQLGKLNEYLSSPTHTWIDISSVSDSDLDQISSILGVAKIILEGELVDESYPRVDYFEHYSMVFARIADVKIMRKGLTRLFVNRSGLLVICKGQNIITLSRTKPDIFGQILEKVKRIHTPEEPLVVSILYTIFKYILERDKQIVTALEQELMILESIPLKERPSNFLEIAFYLRREVNQLVPTLLHLKEIISVIISKRVPLEGFNEKHEELFDILMDEAAYMHETASNARDNLQSLVDLYINTTSYEMNKVMRLIAIVTSLGILPAIISGALGTNIAGNPWNIHLWQLFFGLGILMVALGWIFYRLGWLKR